MTTDALSPSDDHLAEQLRGFGPLSIVAILAILLVGNYPIAPMGAILVLVWVHLSRTPWSEIGYVRPDSWTRTILAGALFGIAFKLVMKVLVMPLLGAPAINPAFHYLAENRAALPGAVYAMIAGAGFGEETVFRGWLFERLGKLLGSSAWAKASIVAITASLFGAAHYTLQGFAGV